VVHPALTPGGYIHPIKYSSKICPLGIQGLDSDF